MEYVGNVEPTFGKAVREARNEMGWSQQKLAERLTLAGLRIDPTAITRIERGQRSIRLSEAVTIAAELGIDLNELLHGLENPAQILAHARLQANHQMGNARLALSAMVGFFNDVAVMLEKFPEMLNLIREETSLEVKDSSDYITWVARRVRAIAGRDWVPIGVNDPVRREQLQDLLHAVMEDLIASNDVSDQALKRSRDALSDGTIALRAANPTYL
jgi:transcriptional regulator with XRE-family HTH domain